MPHVPIVKFKEKYPHFPKHQIIEADFFQHKGQYDLIVEQTFFCAISPSLRHDYAQKVYDLLRPSGKLIGVLFNRHFESGPPFGGNANAYRLLFEKRFSSVEILPCYNSIEPRKCSEVFIKITK